MDLPATLVWLRQKDLRLADNPALWEASEAGGAVIPVFILDDTLSPAMGAGSRWWLERSLRSLDRAIAALGGRLAVQAGSAPEILLRLARDTGARRVLWNRRYEPEELILEEKATRLLASNGIEARSLPGNLLFEPGLIVNEQGAPYQIFSAFWRHAGSGSPARPLPTPRHLTPPAVLPPSSGIDALGLASPLQVPDGIWTPGEDAAWRRLSDFLDKDLDLYALRRDHPGLGATSRLSPHLAFGEISPRQIWHAVSVRSGSAGSEEFLRELGWREFSYALLAAYPDLAERPMRPEYAAFPWDSEERSVHAWKQGLTGFPIVDAGMRQLAQTGWIHNRIRMIVGSFLVKDLLTPWQVGEAWFQDRLVDFDLAVNATSWQWVAGCGVDAAPYFRIFNPVLQGEKFDPRGQYVRRWVPELTKLSDMTIHRPWMAPPAALAAAGVVMGQTYPAPIVDHASARRRALGAYHRVRPEPSAIPSSPKPAA